MSKPKIGILHYSAPPVVGGVEAVIAAHTNLLLAEGYSVTIVAGQGQASALPEDVQLEIIPEIDSQHAQIIEMNEFLDVGEVPAGFEQMTEKINLSLEPILAEFDSLIVHNVFTKHFNLPLTVALYRLLHAGSIKRCIAWCHDFTWTSPSSGSKVFDRYPWDLLKTFRRDVVYVVVSKRRQRTLADLLDCALEEIKVVYNGVDPAEILGLTQEGQALIERLELFDDDLILLMPVRVTKAKNIELALKVVSALKEKFAPKLVLTGPPDPHDAKNMEYFHSLQELRRELGVEREMRFVFESGPDPDKPYFIGLDVVGDLFRVSDAMFMPSHREGFGMPVLEAALVGIPVISTSVPAAQEIGADNVVIFDAEAEPQEIAALIIGRTQDNPLHRHRRSVRQQYTWRAIFDRDIQPLLRA
ncbi:MAG TPA: glycosyltransferase family 4 protein [Anaerolineales bacterium]